jgi:predicted amidohydrolase YtcJ
MDWRIEARGVFTGDASRPWQSTAAVRAGRFVDPLAVDSPLLRLGECWILPGLIDAHLHLLMGGLSLSRLDLSTAHTREEFEQMVAAHAATLAPSAWLEAFGWDERSLGGARPTADWLRGAGERCAVAWRCDQHVALANHAAMSQIDLTQSLPGGSIERAPDGSPIGIFVEQAAWRLLIPAIPPPTMAARERALADAASHLAALGVTSCGAMEYLADIEAVLLPRALAHQLPLRVFATILDRDGTLPTALARARELPTTDCFRAIGFKSFADGTLGSSTAAMMEPYSDSSGAGELVEHARNGTLVQWMEQVLAAGFSPSVHAIGDRALDLVLQAAERADPERRVRFEHAQTVDPASLPRFDGRRLSMQPFHKATDAPTIRARLGESRENRAFRFRDFLNHGGHLAFGSDWPISSADPLEGMRTAITGLAIDGREYWPGQTLTPLEAIEVYTIGAAECLGAPSALGRIAPGFAADFVALDRDPLTCDWHTAAPRVLLTAIGGRIVYDAVGATSEIASTTR